MRFSRLHRGLFSDLPSSLEYGTVYICTDTKQVFFGQEDRTLVEIRDQKVLQEINAIKEDITAKDTHLKSEIEKTNSTVEANKQEANSKIEHLTEQVNQNQQGSNQSLSQLEAKVDKNKRDTDTTISGLTQTVTNNKNDADSKYQSNLEKINANKETADNNHSSNLQKINANKQDADQKYNSNLQKINANKSEADRNHQSNLEKINANKSDADSKINNLRDAHNRDKQALETNIREVSNTVTANKSATDSEIAKINERLNQEHTSTGGSIGALEAKVNQNKQDADNKYNANLEKINQNKAYGESTYIKRAEYLLGNQDFNNLITPGAYFLVGAVHTNKPSSLQSGKGGFLQVSKFVSQGNSTIIQVFTDEVSGVTYSRVKTYSDNNTSWTEWNTHYSMNSKPNPGDINSYTKQEIDNKDTATINSAKGYTYSKAEIDSKDTSTLNNAKAYADTKKNEITSYVYGELAKKLNLSGGTMTGNISFASGKCVVSANNYGIMGFLSDGSNADYLIYMGADNEIKLSYNNRPVNVQTDTFKIKGNRVYHQGYKPSAKDIGALPTGKNMTDKDLNTIKEYGMYFGYRGMTNAPMQGIAIMTVTVYSPDWVEQRFTLLGDTGKTYTRNFYNGDTWSNWVIVYDQNYKPSPAEIGALGKTEKAESAKNADTVGGRNFVWEYGTGNPTHIWGSSGSSTNMQVWSPDNITVGRATRSNTADSVSWENVNGRPTQVQNLSVETICGGGDLNTYNPERIWSARTVNSTENRPKDYMSIFNFGVNNNSNGQLAWNYDAGELDLKFRKRHDNSGNYGEWRTIYHEGHKPSPADIGAVSKRGDTIEGRLNIGQNGKYANVGVGDDDVAIQNTKSGKWLQLKDNGTLAYSNRSIQLAPQKSPLWSGATYLNKGHNFTPSKPLSQCQNGWVLVFSDYDVGGNPNGNDYNWATFFVPKNSAIVGSGNTFFLVPNTEGGGSTVKVAYITDTQVLGQGDMGACVGWNDVVLREILEY